MTADLVIIFSLVSLGFFGGFSHCVGMCGPFVLMQVSNRLQKVRIEKFSNLERLKNLSLLPYHLGRITTYSVAGFCCSLLTKSVEDFIGFKLLSSLFLLIASLIFLGMFFGANVAVIGKKMSKLLSGMVGKISGLFANPEGFNGYVLGVLLGFIPCGLLYGAFLISASISNPIFAAIGMFCFGISTFPALFLIGFSGHVIKILEMKFLTKLVLLINALTLFLMALKSLKY